MPTYRWTIEFEAADRDEAEEQVYGGNEMPEGAALSAFDSVVTESLEEIGG